jgi:putative copper export protein
VGPDAAAVAERALLLLCLYQAVGAALFIALYRSQVASICERARRLGGMAAVCGLALALLQLPLTAARMAGDYSGLHDARLLRLAMHSSQGLSCALLLTGLALLAIGLLWRRALAAAWVGAAIAVCAPALTGHTSVHPQRALLVPLLVLHVLVGAFWLGALWPLRLTVRLERSAVAAAVLQRFSKLAAWLVPCIALAGFGMAYALIDDVSVLQRPYGLLLLGKLVIFAGLLGLAALNRWRFAPVLAAAPARARSALQRSIVAEYLLIAAVLVMTATLTTLFSPED